MARSNFTMLSKYLHPLFLVVFFSWFSLVISAPDDASKLSDTVVHSQNGPVKGIIQKSRNASVEYVSFLGLRYADPSVRFQPAASLKEVWSSPKIASTPGNVCVQPGLNGSIGSDDCLFINVHVPKSVLEDNSTFITALPVIFWIHTGGFTIGDGHSYSADYLMENQDVILVTVNHRLGVMGFIATEDSTFVANNGLRDLVVALQWVQGNIAAFRGDPWRVTISGASGGAAVVHYLLMSPLAVGLYQGAIMQGGSFAFWSYAENPKEAATNFAKAISCNDTGSSIQIRKCLEEKSADELIMTQSTFAPRWPANNPLTRFLPTAKEFLENPFFPCQPSSFFTFHGETPQYPNNVPVILGVSKDDGFATFLSFILAMEDQLSELNDNWNELAPRAFFFDGFVPKDKHAEVSKKLRKYYFGNASITKDNEAVVAQMYTDSLWIPAALLAAEDMAKCGLNVWAYNTGHYGEKGGLENYGIPRYPGKVSHADEMQYLFRHPIFGLSLEPDSEDEKFSKNFVKLWTSFAKTGVPASLWAEDKILNWNPVQPSSSLFRNFNILEIDNEPKRVSLEFRERIAFWRSTLWEAAEKQAVGYNLIPYQIIQLLIPG